MDKKLYATVKDSEKVIAIYCRRLESLSEAFATVGNQQVADNLSAYAGIIAFHVDQIICAMDDNIDLQVSRDMRQIDETIKGVSQ